MKCRFWELGSVRGCSETRGCTERSKYTSQTEKSFSFAEDSVEVRWDTRHERLYHYSRKRPLLEQKLPTPMLPSNTSQVSVRTPTMSLRLQSQCPKAVLRRPRFNQSILASKNTVGKRLVPSLRKRQPSRSVQSPVKLILFLRSRQKPAKSETRVDSTIYRIYLAGGDSASSSASPSERRRLSLEGSHE
jgi:hypothetical protein